MKSAIKQARVLSAKAADTNRLSRTQLLILRAAETKIWGVGRVQALQQLSRAQRSTISAVAAEDTLEGIVSPKQSLAIPHGGGCG